ncbi:MAG: diacylglycerol kinase family protein [Bacillota bacterium]
MRRVITSFKYAGRGLWYCFATQKNMIVHALIGALVLIAAWGLQVSAVGFLFLLTAIFSVLVAETFNTALEKAIDLFTQERSSFAQGAKDIAAGAVLLTAVFAVLVGLIVLGPPLWKLIKASFLFCWIIPV